MATPSRKSLHVVVLANAASSRLPTRFVIDTVVGDAFSAADGEDGDDADVDTRDTLINRSNTIVARRPCTQMTQKFDKKID
jgi:hypothetical protein